VQARWHAFRETSEEVGVARGGFLPRVDVSAGIGRERLTPRSVGADTTYTRHDTLINLRQMIFDGFATSSEVKRLGKAKLVRYFELLDASENTALEAGRAYLDVVRYRRLAYLAEENYIQHQAAYEQLRRRAESGVGKRVDVDQAASRLALADVNLTTALANLHDVTARYLRIVGEQPAKVMFAPAGLATAFPERADAALLLALRNNPALRSTIENIEASQYDLEARRAAFSPRVELIARKENINNYLGLDGSRDNSVVEMRLFYNLFNGGSDIARDRQYRERKNIALDQREKACRDIRQTLSIAYHDTVRLADQLSFLALQVDLVERTRNAYRDQFNIGQRTLLDLLNTQNEFFDARRSQVNADVDLSLAYLRSYAGMGRLLEKLGLKRAEAESAPDEKEMAPARSCPVVPADGACRDPSGSRDAGTQGQGTHGRLVEQLHWRAQPAEHGGGARRCRAVARQPRASDGKGGCTVITSVPLRALLAGACLLLTAGGLHAQGRAGSPTLDKIRAAETVYLGYREGSAPFAYLDPEQKAIGFSLDLCRHVTDAIQARLGLPALGVVQVPTTPGSRQIMLEAETIDLDCGPVTNTEQRQRSVAYSVTIFVAGVKALVRQDSSVRSLKDLKDKVVVTTAGTTAEAYIKSAAARQGLLINYRFGRDHAESLRLLLRGDCRGAGPRRCAAGRPAVEPAARRTRSAGRPGRQLRVRTLRSGASPPGSRVQEAR
jgi:TolC family type I secretion outer membrane protein